MRGSDLICEHFAWATRAIAPHLARSFRLHLDDAETACTRALIVFAARYDGIGDFRRRCYARCRTTALHMATRDEKRLRRRFGYPVADLSFDHDGGAWARQSDAAMDAACILARLDPQAARLLRLHYLEGRDFAEIGRLTGCNEVTAKRRTRKAAEAARAHRRWTA